MKIFERKKQENQPTARFLAQVNASLDPDHPVQPLAVERMARFLQRSGKPAETAADYLPHFLRIEAFAQMEDYEAGDIESFIASVEGIDPEDLAGPIIEKACEIRMRSEPPPTQQTKMGADYSRGPDFQAKMIDGVRARMNPAHEPKQGREFAQMSFAELASECEMAAGASRLSARGALNRFTMAAGHTTSDFPIVLSGVINLELAQSFQQQTPEIMQAASQLSGPDFRLRTRPRLSTGPELKKGAENSELTYGTFLESGEYAPLIETYRKGFRLTREALVNDNLSAFAQIPIEMARGATTTARKVVTAPLLANSGMGQSMRDGDPVFDANHSNLPSSGGSLSVTTVQAATTAMRRQVGLQGEVIDVRPWALVVPPELEGSALQLVANINPNEVDRVNQFSGRLRVFVEPGLTDTNAWYVVADPSLGEGLAYSYLDGFEGPRVEERPGWEVEGMEWKVILDFGAAFTDWRTWYQNPGV